MVGLITWTTYGTWLSGRARGRAESPGAIPEPDPRLSAGRRRGLAPWPSVRLDRRQGWLIVADLYRIAALRRFTLHAVVVAGDHVHVLLADGDRPDGCSPRLVQLIKGALSRRLSVTAGDTPAVAITGGPLPHHKWWTRQHDVRRIDGATDYQRVRAALQAHARCGDLVHFAADPPAWAF
jgi:REP element-mobilizing transposase RayT